MSADHSYFVYTLASRSRALYTGVTNNLERRILQHRSGEVSGFTARYRIHRLVHFEEFADIREAIQREKEIKGWRRSKKVAMIEAKNPAWTDLSEGLSPALATKKQVPHPASRGVRDDRSAVSSGREGSSASPGH
jgi:putative endonuclease